MNKLVEIESLRKKIRSRKAIHKVLLMTHEILQENIDSGFKKVPTTRHAKSALKECGWLIINLKKNIPGSTDSFQ